MDSADLSPQSIAQMGEASLLNFKVLNDFAKSTGITISGIYVYIAIGALNIHTLDNSRIMFAGVTAARAAKSLNFSPKRMGRWLITLAERGLLLREDNGAYKVADLNAWLEVSRLVGGNNTTDALSADAQRAIAEFQAAKIGYIAMQSDAPPMRDRF